MNQKSLSLVLGEGSGSAPLFYPEAGMPIETLFISGPSMGGKSTLARTIADRVLVDSAHYIRVLPAKDGHTNAVLPPCEGCSVAPARGWKSIHQVSYTPDRVFETLPDGLRAVRNIDRQAFTIIEADGDPALRHAYPYDYRIFVMPRPRDVHVVFRPPKSAAAALQQVMQDTAAFASEIFGLFDTDNIDDFTGVQHQKSAVAIHRNVAVERLDINELQIREFVRSPLGIEIASRIQLQPEYHALVESDIVVINTGVGDSPKDLGICVKRLEKLLAKVRHDARRRSVLYWGNITDTHDPVHRRLLHRLRVLLTPEAIK